MAAPRETIVDPGSRHPDGGAGSDLMRFSMLAVDDNGSDLDVLRRLIRRIPNWEVDLRTSSDPIEALALLRDRSADLVIADYGLGALNGVQLLEQARKSGFEGACIIMTGQGDERVAAEAMRSGASDYLPKADLTLQSLQRAARNAIERSRLQITLGVHRRRLEFANRDLQRRNTEIQSFYHTLSHELKTPLTSALEFVSILLEGLAGPLTSSQTEYLGFVKESCDQMRVCLNDILDVARMETGRLSLRPAPQDLTALVRRTLRSFEKRARESKITLHERLAADLPGANVDPHRFAQVLGNLVDNALKFTAEGGAVAIEVEADADPRWIRVRVSDTGRGIPAEHRAEIFDRLYQVRDGSEQSTMGLGLGLFICREIVRLHGGEITVESEVGKGTTFQFTCPAIPVDQAFNPEREAGTHA
ncbi:MAG: ATP-binding protein [Planctomycetota bacterium]